jgi:hypothetical protein
MTHDVRQLAGGELATSTGAVAELSETGGVFVAHGGLQLRTDSKLTRHATAAMLRADTT